MEGIRPGLCARVCWTRPTQLAVGTDLRVLEEPDFPGRGVQGRQEGTSVWGGGALQVCCVRSSPGQHLGLQLRRELQLEPP